MNYTLLDTIRKHNQYTIVRRKADGTFDIQPCKPAPGVYSVGNTTSAEYITIPESELIKAFNQKLVYIGNYGAAMIKIYNKLYPITQQEQDNAQITEDEFWKFIELINIRANKGNEKPHKYILETLAFDMTKLKALAVADMAFKIHKLYYGSGKGVSKWWKLLGKYFYDSDDSFNDLVYGIMYLGKDVFYDIYNNPTEDTVKKYYKDIKNIENTSELIGYELTKYRIDNTYVKHRVTKDIPNDCF